MTQIRFGIIGFGNIAKRHLRILNKLDATKVVSVCDLDDKKLKELDTLENSKDITTYTNYQDMLNNEEIDIISILTSSGSHAKIALDVIKHGKHLIIEKPLALRLSDIDKLIKEAEKYSVKIFEVKQNRFNLPVIALKKALNEDWFKKIVLGSVRVMWCRDQHYYDQADWRGTWAKDGGVLANQACHHLDMLIWFLGNVKEVMAMTTTQLANIETEDTAIVNLKFENGALGVIQATTATRPKDLEGSLCVLGEKGAVEIGGFAMTHLKTWQFEDDDKAHPTFLDSHKENPQDRDYAHEQFLITVIEDLNKDTSEYFDIQKARHVVEVLHAIYISAESGQKINLPLEKGLESKLGLESKVLESN